MKKTKNTNEIIDTILVRLVKLLVGTLMILLVISLKVTVTAYARDNQIQVVYFAESNFARNKSVEEQAREYVMNMEMPDMSDVPTFGEEIQDDKVEEQQTQQVESVSEEPLVIVYDEKVIGVDYRGEPIYKEDVILLSQLMHAEEGVLWTRCSYEDAKRAHLLCVSAVLHRRDSNYREATTIREVIFSPSQYDSTEKLEQKVPEETIQLAYALLTNGPIGPSNLIYQSQSRQGTDVYEKIDNQYFCLE